MTDNIDMEHDLDVLGREIEIVTDATKRICDMACVYDNDAFRKAANDLLYNTLVCACIGKLTIKARGEEA